MRFHLVAGLLAALFTLGLTACDDEKKSSEDTLAADTQGELPTDVTGQPDAQLDVESPSDTDVTTQDDAVDDEMMPEVIEDTLADTTVEAEVDLIEDSGPIACALDSDCTGDSEVCNRVTHLCVYNDRCLSLGSPCDPAANHPLLFACMPDANGDPRCVASCYTHSDCPSGHFCAGTTDDPSRGVCWPSECDGLWDTTSCGAGNKCIPEYNSNGTLALDVFSCVAFATNPASAGESCAFYGDCAQGSLCVADGAGGAFCEAFDCTPATGTLLCGANAACTASLNGVMLDAGACYVGQCEAFTTPSGCLPYQTCVPSARDAYDGTLVGTCMNTGGATGGAQGASCTSNSGCVDGPLCIGNTCRKICDPLDLVGTCTAAETCVRLTDTNGKPYEVGACFPSNCDYFGTPCPNSGEYCSSYLFREPSGALPGSCAAVGSTGRGQACTSNSQCAGGLLCVGTCELGCDPLATSGAGACATGESCYALYDNASQPLPLGICFATCTPYVTNSGCSANQWCMPDFGDDSFGYCTASGTVGAGGNCSSALCGDGIVCVGGTCETICELHDPSSTCATNEACEVLSNSSGQAISFGICVPGCDYDVQSACPVGQTCAMGELFGQLGADTCASYVASSCSSTTLGQICAGDSVCMDVTNITNGIECLEFCRADAGEFLHVGHPDCSDTSAICDPINVALGLCNPPQ